MKKILIITLGLFLLFNSIGIAAASGGEEEKKSILFVSFFGYEEQLSECLTLCESIRTFAGSFSKAPITVYFPESLTKLKEKYKDKFSALNVDLKSFKAPKEAFKYDLGTKPFIAARAEKDALQKADILAYLDPNIIILKEPRDFILKTGKHLGYRPVMHRNIGSLYSEKPDAFWSRLYKVLNVSESTLFPMEAIADKNILRPYFNAGLLIVRPEKGIMGKWAEHFQISYEDEEIAKICKEGLHNIFLHQAALVGAILNHVKQEEMELFPFAYNYPLFFELFYDSKLKFDSIEDIISLKCEIFKKQLPADWDKRLKGSPEVIEWIKKHFFKNE